MNKYVVAIINFFDNELKQFIIEAESDYEAFKEAMVKSCKDEESAIHERSWQSSNDYPKTIEELDYTSANWDLAFSVIKID